MVTADLGLFYPAVSAFEVKMMDTLERNDLPAAINCIFFKGFDYTAMKVGKILIC